jgi:hypothetical protein
MSTVVLCIDPSRVKHSSIPCCNSSDNIGVWELHFVTTDEGRVRNLNNYTRTGRMFQDLRFRGQWNTDRPDQGVYSNELSIKGARIHRVSEAQELLDVMKTIEKARESIAISPASFGQYIVLMCQALKIRKAVIQSSERTRSGWGSYDDYDFRELTMASSVQTLIDDTIQRTYPQKEAVNA